MLNTSDVRGLAVAAIPQLVEQGRVVLMAMTPVWRSSVLVSMGSSVKTVTFRPIDCHHADRLVPLLKHRLQRTIARMARDIRPRKQEMDHHGDRPVSHARVSNLHNLPIWAARKSRNRRSDEQSSGRHLLD